MCIVFHKPQGIVLSREILENCFESNSHGAGFMAAVNGELIVKKGYFTFEELWEAYEPFQAENLVAHFRWATHGLKNDENCHPFNITNDLAFAHNGVIYGIHQTGSNNSDTWHFNEEILKPIFAEFNGAWKHKTVKHLITKKIGGYNRLVFLDADGSVAIYNEEKGTKKHGCWFSNDDFEKLRTRHTTANNYNRSSMISQYRDDYGYGHGHGNGYFGEAGHYSSPANQSAAYSNNSAGWNGGNVVVSGTSSKKNEGHGANSGSPNGTTSSSLGRRGGKTFLSTDDGLIEVSPNVLLDDERPRIEEITADNEYYICDNCNNTVKEEDLYETSNFRMCKDCVAKEGTQLACIDPMLKQLIAA